MTCTSMRWIHAHIAIRQSPRLDRSCVSGLRTAEFGDLIFVDQWSTKIRDTTFEFLIVLDGTTSHLTVYPCKSTSPSQVFSRLNEWMDTFQMNPKAMCADMALHHAHDMQAIYRVHNVKSLPIGSHTSWPIRADMGVRLFKKFPSALLDTVFKNLDETTPSQTTPALLMREAATVRNTQITLSGKTPMELVMRRRPRHLTDPASMSPEQ